MTVIVGIPHNGRVYLGADTRATVGWAEGKLWKQDGIVFGLAGQARENQIMQYALTLPPRLKDADIVRWLCFDFVNALRAVRRDSGFDVKMADPPSDRGPYCLIGIEGRLFTMFSDYHVMEKLGATAIGSGGSEARGSLHTTERMRLTVRRRIDLALSAACELDASCGPPFTYAHT